MLQGYVMHANAPSASIYAHLTPTVSTRAARQARRARAQARLTLVQVERPPLQANRTDPILRLLRTYREGQELGRAVSPLSDFLAHLEAEVGALEAWAQGLEAKTRRGGPAIRQALEFLRTFGRITAFDFSSIPEEERAGLVTLLALEHRWCYAAAGTSRELFKAAIGRTGAR
ncbi:MAG: hypothetical protein IPG45_10245 [Deltaproteobacteria bacterium]|nr:hypothetical protein [Deltaproteobacteria bacterium]